MFSAQKINGYWYVVDDETGKTKCEWLDGHMPISEQQCIDAARRLNDGATIQELPHYQPRQNMQRIVAVAPWGDTYTAQDAEDGYIPSEAYYRDEEEMEA